MDGVYRAGRRVDVEGGNWRDFFSICLFKVLAKLLKDAGAKEIDSYTTTRCSCLPILQYCVLLCT